MTFDEVLEQAVEMLRRRGRISYRALKVQFQLDDDLLELLIDEIVAVHQLARDQEGKMLVWTGATATAAPAFPAARDQERAPLAHTPSYLAEKILTSRSALEGERKHITVLFADLKGSMELLAERNPEDARQLLDPVLERMMAAVHRYEGTVNQIMGDGIMALFGAPLAHEDHALRACYAALAMQAALHHYSNEVRRTHGLAVHFRVGLNSGEVVVRAISNDLHMDYSAIGQTVHLAARMEQMATPGSILLTAATLRLVEGLVRVHALGPIPVKGLADPVESYELVGASAHRGRWQAAMARGLTPFTGRQPALDVLHQARGHAEAGRGQVVAVIGEPGVGKTRLVHEFTLTSRTQGWLRLESSATAYGQAIPYLPLIELLKAYVQLEERDDAQRIRERLTGRLLTVDPALGSTVPAFLALLEVPVEDPHWQALDPSQRRQRTLDALKRLLVRESQVHPLLLVFENLHWIDAETRAFLDGLVESLPAARLLLLVNYRPEYQHGWGTKTYYTQLRLDPLPPASAEAMLQSLLGNAADLEPLTQRLIAWTQGNPFFLEESVRTLVESGVLVGEPGAYRLAQALPSIQVPATVQAVLAARIDRLPPEEKQLLQTAAVIGTEVPLALLQAVAEMPEGPLRLGLTHLQAAEFFYETRLFPDLEYTFKHALTHEVAYSSLLQERRRMLHGRVVEALEALYADRLAEQTERLAHHAWRSERWDKAVAYFRQAGVKAIARSANRDAVVCFEQALDALQHLPECHDTIEQAIDLRLGLRNALHALGDSERMFAILREAERLAEVLDDHQRLASISNHLSNYFVWKGAPDRAVASSQNALMHATACGDVTSQVVIRFNLAWAYVTMGDYRQAIDLNRSIAEFVKDDVHSGRASGGGFMSVLCRNTLAWMLAECGAFAEGLAYGEEGIRLAETSEHPGSLARIYNGVGQLYLRKGDLPEAIAMLEQAWHFCQVAHITLFAPIIAANLGSAYALSGRVAEALPLLEHAVAQAASMGHMGHQAYRVVQLSEGSLLADRIEDASDLAERAFELAHIHKERGTQAYALRLRGEIATRRELPDNALAQAHYQQALALAEELGMRPLVAHCHLGLGTLYTRLDQQEQAYTELSIAIDLYRAMDMTYWLSQAEAALAQLETR